MRGRESVRRDRAPRGTRGRASERAGEPLRAAESLRTEVGPPAPSVAVLTVSLAVAARQLGFLVSGFAFLVGACENSETDAATGRCVWNQAYQENYREDSVDEMLFGAHGCYVLIDPFGSSDARNAIATLRQNENVVGCYMSSGTCEEWRDDFEEMRDYCVSEPWEQWEGEYFVDVTDESLLALMQLRIDRLAEWGCDMVEFDNMDWAFDSENRKTYGIDASEDDAMAYNGRLCEYAHRLDVGCMAKNTRRGAKEFDGGTFESYTDERDWWPHEDVAGFLAEGKLGIVVHYNEPNCDDVYADYREAYGDMLSFICEERTSQSYRHYGERGGERRERVADVRAPHRAPKPGTQIRGRAGRLLWLSR